MAKAVRIVREIQVQIEAPLAEVQPKNTSLAIPYPQPIQIDPGIIGLLTAQERLNRSKEFVCYECQRRQPLTKRPAKLSMRQGLPGLHRMRIRRGLSQTELAEALGISGQYIGKLELGQRDCKTILLRQIQMVLQCGFDELFRE